MMAPQGRRLDRMSQAEVPAKRPVTAFLPVLFLSILFISSVSFAQSSCEVATNLNFSSSGTPTSADSNWKTLCIVGLFIASLLTAMIFMLGRALDNQSLINRAKTDLYQIMVTAAILVVFASFISGLCAIDATQFGLTAPSLFDASRSYFLYAQSVAFNSYISTVNSIMLLSGLSSLYVKGEPIKIGAYIGIGMDMRPFAGFTSALGALNLLSNLTMLSVSITSGFITILNAIETWFLNLLLPAGVVLRCFTPTREFGGVLISIAIGLFIFYPLLFAFSYMLIGQLPPLPLPDTGGWLEFTLSELAIFSSTSILPFGLIVTTLGQMLFIGGMAGDSIAEAFTQVGGALLPVFILPAINWIILVSIVKGISRVMGEEVDISSLTRLI